MARGSPDLPCVCVCARSALKPGFRSEPPDIMVYPAIPASHRLKPSLQALSPVIKPVSVSQSRAGIVAAVPSISNIGSALTGATGAKSARASSAVDLQPKLHAQSSLSSLAQFEAAARAAAVRTQVAKENDGSDRSDDDDYSDTDDGSRHAPVSQSGRTMSHSLPDTSDAERQHLLLQRSSSPMADHAAKLEQRANNDRRKASRSGCGIFSSNDDASMVSSSASAGPAGTVAAVATKPAAGTIAAAAADSSSPRKGELIPRSSIPESQRVCLLLCLLYLCYVSLQTLWVCVLH